MGGALYGQFVEVFVHGLHHPLGQRMNALTVGDRAFDDSVVDVSDVAHKSDLVATGLEPALHHVKRDVGTGMANVTKVIHRNAANIQAHMARL